LFLFFKILKTNKMKNLLLTLTLILSSVLIFGQNTVKFTASSETAVSGSNVCVKITIDGFNNVGSFDFGLEWNPAVLTFIETKNFGLTGLDASKFSLSGNNTLNGSWFSTTGLGQTLPNGTVMAEICFTAIGAASSTPITFKSPLEVTDGSANSITFTQQNGLVTVTAAPCPNVGAPCNDNNPNTNNDVINANCVCVGTPIVITPILTLNCPINISTAAAIGATTKVVNFTAPTGTTTCTTGSIATTQTSGLASGSAFPVGTTQICYSATDGCGTVKTCCFSVIVTATPATLTLNCPTFTGINTAPVGATSMIAAYQAPTLISNCSGNLTRTSGLASGSLFPIGITQVCYLATDNCGGSKTCCFDVTVVSAQPTNLSLNCPTNLSATTALGATTAIINYTAPTTTTTCTTGSITTTRTSGLASGSAFPIGTTQVCYSATDGCGNTKTCCFSVIVTGAQPTNLTLNCPNDASATAALGATTAIVNYTAPTSTTTCTAGSITTTRTSGLGSGSAFPIGTTQVCYSATDGCGNTKTCCFSVIVTGTQPTNLTLNCPNDASATAAVGATTAIVNYTAPTSTTTCSTGSITTTRTSGLASGTAFPVGTTQVCYLATDGCGNTRSCCFNVVVQTAPIGSVCDAINILGGNSKISISGLSPTNKNSIEVYKLPDYSEVFKCIDNCLTPLQEIPSLFSGSYLVKIKNYSSNWQFVCEKEATVTVTGSNGNNSVLTMNCTQGNQTVTALAGQNKFIVNYLIPTATTTCPGGMTSIVRLSGLASGDLFPIGTTNIVYQAADACGNSKTCSFAVTVNLAPGDPCAVVTVTAGNGEINLAGLATNKRIVQVFKLPDYEQAFSCADDCNSPTLKIPNLAAGNYFVKVDLYSANWQFICKKEAIVTILPPTSGGMPCDIVSVTASTNSASVTNLPTDKVVIVQVFRKPSYQIVFECQNNCAGATQNIPNLSPGEYEIKVTIYGTSNTGWFLICQKKYPVLISSNLVSNEAALNFHAYKKDFNVSLKWTSTTGKINKYFVVERSTDSVNFEPIQQVNGEGPADEILQFSEKDKNPMRGDNYYRLHLYFQNGNDMYSEVRKINFGHQLFKAFPNPAWDKTAIDLSIYAGTKGTLTVCNALGVVVKTQKIDALPDSPFEVDLDGLLSGYYNIVFSGDTIKSVTIPLILSRL
jgi:hypothetical protein